MCVLIVGVHEKKRRLLGHALIHYPFGKLPLLTPQRGKFHCILINPHTSLGLDLIPGFICFFVGLFSELDYGIFAGMGVHLAMVLYQIARPKVEVEVKVLDRTGTDYIFISPDQGGHEHLNIDRGFLFSPLLGKSCF